MNLIHGCNSENYSANFHEIKDASSWEFEAAMEIYVASFQENEQRPKSSIREMLNCGRSRLIVGDTGGKIVFMALLYPIRDTPFLLGDYLATAECCRNRGIGKAFLRYIVNEMKNTHFDRLLIQIEDPHDSCDETKIRRMNFYKRIGMKELKGVKYILPPLQGTKTTDLVLMTNPGKDEHCLGCETVRNLVIRMFGELYGRYDGDEFLTRTLESIPKLVLLD